MKNLFFLSFAVLILNCCGNDDDGGPSLDCEPTIGNEFLVYNYYNENEPVLSIQPTEERGNIFYEGASAQIVSNGVEVTIPGIRIRTDQNNFEVVRIKIDERENGASCFVNQSEFDSGTSDFKTDIASVLVLDMSTSLQSNADQLKEYAKNYANTIVSSSDNSTVAIVFFSDRDAIETTDFYTSSNISELNSIIDNFTNYQERTALYQATKEAIDLLENFDFEGEKSLVSFTDGGDNDSNNPAELVSTIMSSGINRFAIGLEGDDFRQDNLSNITSIGSNIIIASDIGDLENVFRVVGRGVISVYEIKYVRSDQILNENESLDIRISMESRIIE